ncbi:ammonium transporter Rh type A isoform X1 [Glossina fuscipes]|uniref:Ammonium transporter Rh type A isoform X1 n=2 Tax=Glossina fuscipes TaxID=7396 RepID=A0A8U0W7N0_9MUSC|nr:ammonium transporter Rh type A isoform X1 [Glossina fuscipes]
MEENSNKAKMHSPISERMGFVALMILQIILFMLFAVFVRYGKAALPAEVPGLFQEHVSKYPHFQDVHVMIFVGFGFLMTFLKKYGYSATGYTLFMSALIIQWTILVKGFFHMYDGKIELSLEHIIHSDISAAVPLISMGVLLGRTTPIQLLFMALFEIILFAVNEYVALEILSICDVGGSITVHAFGAYFGLAVSLMLRPKKEENEPGQYEAPTYTSDLFAMIGTLFLWIYWPSFNSVLADGTAQERAILNTYLSLAGATVTAFVLSTMMSHEKKLDMVHVQNSTLAGGVAVGTVCNLMIGGHGAILIGILAGSLSVIGYRYVTPAMTAKLRLHDTCGVHNLHGMPGIIAGLGSIVYAYLATKEDYKYDLGAIFPAMASQPKNLTSNHIIGGYERSARAQAGFQLFGLFMTIIIAIVGGLIVGLVLRCTCFRKLQKEEQHQDELYWEVPELKSE